MSEEIEDVVEADGIESIESEQDASDSPEPQAPQFDPEDVEEAQLFGWKSPDDWQGDKPEGYIDNPNDFLDRVKRSRIFSTMQEKLDRQDQESAATARRLEAMSGQALERQRRDYEARLAEIGQGQREAVENADTEAFDRLEKQRLTVSKDMAQSAEPQVPQIDPTVQAYAASEKGSWLKNPILKDTAAKLVSANPAVQAAGPQAQIDYAEDQIRKLYPAFFPDTPQPKPAQHRQVVDGGGLAGGGITKKTGFSKLPSEAKAQFSKFVKEGIFADTKEDREEYTNDYLSA